MSVGNLSSQQLRTLVEDKWRRDHDAVAVGFHVAPSWQGPDEVEFKFGKANVVRADTVFEVREALLSAEKEKNRIVLLTRLQQGDLGHDVVARFARSRLFPVDHWTSLCSLFKAKELDRSVADPAITQALMDYAPPDGYPPVSAGLLDAGTVWRAICRRVFDMGEREPDLVALLLWSASKERVQRYQQAGEDICKSLRHRLIQNLGDCAETVLRFLESGAGTDVLPLAVACQVVFGRSDQPILDAAAARMERYHGNKPIANTVGQTLGRGAVDAIGELDRHANPRIAQQHLQHADELLRQFNCDDSAYRSSLSLRGFEQRLSRLGVQLKRAVDTTTDQAIAGCERLLDQITDHRIAKLGIRQEQVSKAEMAVRLARWLHQSAGNPQSFSEHAANYIRDTSFVDWAREPLCRGESVTELAAAYHLLDQRVSERRAELNRVFAMSLADWCAFGSNASDVLGVEDVLAQVVSKVAEAKNRVLLVLLDGMSWAICHELLEDLRQDHWFEATLDGSNRPPAPVIATVPSTTTYSRTSLLSGLLTKGDQNDEKKNFEANKSLAEHSNKRYPPALFHKKDVTEGSRGAVSEELSRTVLSSNHRVVGIVLNAIDDRLSNAQQVIDHWSISTISPLRDLLQLARDSGRVVILASDHGHVWHRPDAKHRPNEAASRWRMNDGATADDEIIFRGNRVMEGGREKSIVVPWTETVYYRHQQNGYHGGATPQEMICPLILLKDESSEYSGLSRCEYPKPDWWAAAPLGTSEIEEPQVNVSEPTRTGPPTLFDIEPEKEREQSEPQGTGWIERLVASTAYKDQKVLVRRHPPNDELVRACLTAMNSSGGIMTPAAFARAAEVPAARLDGLIAQMQRILNVDGYEILTMDRRENRVDMNVAKLKRQFDLD